MCIAAFIWKSHPLHPFLLLLNRDEYHNRPTTPLRWWDDGEILGGRDEQAGGTWLACSRDGKLVFLTNVREIRTNPLAKSRGDLPVRYLKSKKSPKEFSEELSGETDLYGGFNLIVADLCSMSMVYITNRPKDCGLSIAEVSPGIHVLSNAKLDTPWPKVQVSLHWKGLLSYFSNWQGRYGTRSTSAVVLKTSGEVCFYEKYLEEDMWKKHKVSYHIEK
ncbi:uncharacterized protein [Henckelia pumila]|uniref:uncharacterized protein isoform X3 n=1 Tax=Henckelia pumila TaxID=405737 RepID=UPI003C6DE936